MFKYINLDPSFQGVNRVFVMVYNRANNQPTRNGQQKYYLPRIDLEKYNVIIDGRNFYDNPIESDIEKYRELKKVMIGKGEDYTTGSLLDFNYFNKHYKLVAVDLSKQKELDADPRAIQQIEIKILIEVKILDDKIKANNVQYDLDRMNAEISSLLMAICLNTNI